MKDIQEMTQEELEERFKHINMAFDKARAQLTAHREDYLTALTVHDAILKERQAIRRTLNFVKETKKIGAGDHS